MSTVWILNAIHVTCAMRLTYVQSIQRSWIELPYKVLLQQNEQDLARGGPYNFILHE